MKAKTSSERILQRLFFLSLLSLLFAGRAFASGGSCPTSPNYLQASTNTRVTLATLGIATCYFISPATGVDTNNGTSEATPWEHMPYEAGCSNVCAGVTPTGGEGFILRGGETSNSLFFTIANGGTSNASP